MKITLRQKLVYIPLVVVGVIYIASLYVILSRMNRNNKHEAERLVFEQAHKHAHELQAMLNYEFGKVHSLAISLEHYPNATPEEREVIYDRMLLNTLKSSPDALAAWYSWQLEHIDSTWGRNPGRVSTVYSAHGNEVQKGVDSIDIGGIEKRTGYYDIMKNKRITFMEPYPDRVNGIMETSLIVPLLSEKGHFQGVVGLDITVKQFGEYLSKVKPYERGYSFLLSNKATYVYHPDSTVLMDTFANINPLEDSLFRVTPQIQQGKTIGFYAESSYNTSDVYVLFVPLKIGHTNTPWSLGLIVHMDDVMSEFRTVFRRSIFIGFLGLVLLAALLYLLTRRMLFSIENTMKLAVEYQRGNLGYRIVTKGHDEISLMINALQEMAQRISDTIREYRKGANEITQFGITLNNNAFELSAMAQNYRSETEKIRNALHDILNRLQTNVSRAQQTESITAKASDELSECGRLAKDNTESARTIADRIAVIEEIADKTNMLAINATIEARKAGENGLTFGVVAQEVRKLAELTNSTASEIILLTKQGLSLSEETENLLTQLLPDMDRTLENVRNIVEQSSEQGNYIGQISNYTDNLNSLSIRNEEQSDKLTANALRFTEMAHRLNEQAQWFKL